jgi:Co/Zn/Cd efflux system component
LAGYASAVVLGMQQAIKALMGDKEGDPLVGLAGTAVIGSWAWGLLRAAGRVLVDAIPDAARIERGVRHRLERDGDRMTDFHLWQVGPGHPAVIVSLISDAPAAPSSYKARLGGIAGLSHVTVEVEACPGDHPHLRKAA